MSKSKIVDQTEATYMLRRTIESSLNGVEGVVIIGAGQAVDGSTADISFDYQETKYRVFIKPQLG